MLTQEAATDAKHQREVHIATHLLHITMTTHYQPTQNITLPHFTTRILPQVALQVEKAIAEQDLQN